MNYKKDKEVEELKKICDDIIKISENSTYHLERRDLTELFDSVIYKYNRLSSRGKKKAIYLCIYLIEKEDNHILPISREKIINCLVPEVSFKSLITIYSDELYYQIKMLKYFDIVMVELLSLGFGKRNEFSEKKQNSHIKRKNKKGI